MKASPDVVTLPNHSIYIFEVILKLIELYPEVKVGDIMTVFINAFIDRFDKIILDHCSDAREAQEMSTSTKRLSALEREIFDLHRQ